MRRDTIELLIRHFNAITNHVNGIAEALKRENDYDLKKYEFKRLEVTESGEIIGIKAKQCQQDQVFYSSHGRKKLKSMGNGDSEKN